MEIIEKQGQFVVVNRHGEELTKPLATRAEAEEMERVCALAMICQALEKVGAFDQ